MKHRTNTDFTAASAPATWRFALTSVALAAGCLWASQAWALGLGRLTVQSALGETLRAEIEVTSMTPEEASSLKLRVATPEAYRAAGVEYNAALANAQVQVVRRPDGTSVLRVTSDRAVLEPFVDVILEANWSSGRLVREYTLLFDPPSTRLAQPSAPAAAAVATPAPAPAAPPVAAAPAPAAVVRAPETPRRAPPAPSTAAPSLPPAAAAPARPRAEGADEIRVRSGDTLSGIAGRTQRSGVSLDQMLVSLFRANPQAFMGENMNRLKSGVVLTVPSAEQAGQVGAKEARELIVAQSSDFAAYRQRLAAGATAEAEQAPARQAGGKVQTQVEDRKQAATASPDKLKLSQGAVKPGSTEAAASRDAERKESSTRVAELSRNVEELKKLQAAAAASAPTVAAAPAAAPVPAPAPAPTPAPAAVPPVPAAAPVTPPAAVAPPPAPAPAPAPQPAPVKPAAVPQAEPGWLDSLLENPLLLPGAGVLVALLAGLGLYKLRGRRKAGGETSFLESRLQPDSFFGASGGQRIDTREAPNSQGSSSMSYSLSQLDAIGDVDPVAEADVYLAYGRDLQAEEILKEAMRAAPDRMAIRIKLLEVYAKRKDAKAFELLATQVHNLTHGEGEDWTKAQDLGRGIDPDNPLYQPGGQPEAVLGGSGQPVEPLSASTMPYTAPMSPPTFQPASDARLDDNIDLDLDLAHGAAAPHKAAPSPETTAPISTGASLSAPGALDFELDSPPTLPATPRAPEAKPAAVPAGLDFDLGDLGGGAATKPAAAAAGADFGEFSIGGEPISSMLTEDGDPLERKLELAEEFRQIGDLEGARDLLEEVVAKAGGSLRSKAQTMLDSLA